VHDEDVVLARERDHTLEERQLDALRGGLLGKPRIIILGFG
jgi:hypothetical protein